MLIGKFANLFSNSKYYIFLMTIEYFIFKSGRFFGLAFAILFLFFKYYSLPDMVAVFYNQQSKPEGFLPKDQFFYLISSLLLFINLLFPLLIIIFKKYIFSNKNSKISIGTIEITANQVFEIFQNWINLIITCLNLIILLAVMILAKLNSTEYTTSINNFEWLQIIFFIFIIAAILYPFVKLVIAKYSQKAV
jgi:hypothetical protein